MSDQAGLIFDWLFFWISNRKNSIFMDMNMKRLFRIALFTSPVLALFGITPLYIISKLPINYFWIGLAALTIFCFLIWSQNIIILLKFSDRPILQRYAISYLIVLLLISLGLILRKYFLAIVEIEDGKFFPLLNALAINTIVLIIIDSILSREKKDQAELKLQELKVQNMEAQQQLMIQQFQPHFLFNALSTLKSLMMENLDEAEDYLLKLSDFLRSSVQAHEYPVVTLGQELNFTKKYIEMQEIRFEKAFSCEFQIPKKALGMRIPVFALQALIENALKHNGFSLEQPLSIQVIYDQEKLIISNNKIPKLLTESSGTGLASLNRRHELITSTPIHIQDKEEEFIVTLKLLAA